VTIKKISVSSLKTLFQICYDNFFFENIYFSDLYLKLFSLYMLWKL
jgi:hypothetical protein